jgi:hypothetical protein
VHFPLKEQTTFSAKLIALQGTEEAANLREDEPGGHRIGKGTIFPPSFLSEGDVVRGDKY